MSLLSLGCFITEFARNQSRSVSLASHWRRVCWRESSKKMEHKEVLRSAAPALDGLPRYRSTLLFCFFFHLFKGVFSKSRYVLFSSHFDSFTFGPHFDARCAIRKEENRN